MVSATGAAGALTLERAGCDHRIHQAETLSCKWVDVEALAGEMQFHSGVPAGCPCLHQSTQQEDNLLLVVLGCSAGNWSIP